MTPAEVLTRAIRTIPDHPKPGILFRDITTLLGDPHAFKLAVEGLATPWMLKKPSKVAGLEARGFILGGAVASLLGVGFVPIRKKGKLPHHVHRAKYELEYGTDELEMHVDAVKEDERVLIIDDLIATGGTASAAIELLRRANAEVVGASFVIDLPDLGGAQKLSVPVHTLIAFSGH